MSDLTVGAGNVKVRRSDIIQDGPFIGKLGESVTQGIPVTQDPDSLLWYQGDANVDEQSANTTAITLAEGEVGQEISMTRKCNLDLGCTLTIGEPYFLSRNKGKICLFTDLQTGDWVTPLGFADAVNNLRYDPQPTRIRKNTGTVLHTQAFTTSGFLATPANIVGPLLFEGVGLGGNPDSASITSQDGSGGGAYASKSVLTPSGNYEVILSATAGTNIQVNGINCALVIASAQEDDGGKITDCSGYDVAHSGGNGGVFALTGGGAGGGAGGPTGNGANGGNGTAIGTTGGAKGTGNWADASSHSGDGGDGGGAGEAGEVGDQYGGGSGGNGSTEVGDIGFRGGYVLASWYEPT